MQDHGHVERASQVDIDQVVEILRESVLEIAIEEDTGCIDQNVQATKLLHHCQSHLILLDVNAEVALYHGCLCRVLLPYGLQGIDVPPDECHAGALVQIVVGECHADAT